MPAESPPPVSQQGTQIGVFLAGTLAVAAVCVMFFLPGMLTGRARQGLEHQAVDLTSVAANVIAPAVYARDSEGMDRVLRSVSAIPEVSYAAVVSADGVPVRSLPREQVVPMVSQGGAPTQYIGDVLYVSVAVPGIEPRMTVQVGYSVATLSSQRAMNLGITGLLAALLLAGAVMAGSGARGVVVISAPREPSDGDTGASTAAIVSEDQFLAFISHELRTPLNAIIGYSEMLQEDAIFLEQTDFVPDLKKIKKAGAHLLALVDDFVGLSKVYAGSLALELETFPVKELLEEVERDVAPLLNRTLASLAVQTEGDVGKMTADRGKVLRALTNVVRQATALTAQGDMVLTAAIEESAAGRYVRFRIHHDDLELTAEQVDALIRDFSEEKARSLPQYHGAGLGLIVSREFCKLQGGSLDVVSAEQKGTTFTLRIPPEVRA